jgi:hypothetical protein
MHAARGMRLVHPRVLALADLAFPSLPLPRRRCINKRRWKHAPSAVGICREARARTDFSAYRKQNATVNSFALFYTVKCYGAPKTLVSPWNKMILESKTGVPRGIGENSGRLSFSI